MKTVSDFLSAANGFQFNRLNNRLNVQLKFERCKVVLHHRGNNNSDFSITVMKARLYPNGNENGSIEIEPKDLTKWLKEDQGKYEFG